MTKDIRDRIFFKVRGKRYLARISSQGEGILSGTQQLRTACKRLKIQLRDCRQSGTKVRPLENIAILEGEAKQIALAEEELIGWIAKASGIATAAWKAKTAAGKELRVVSGAWKKMPSPLKELVRQAVADGGIDHRISERPFVYLDKNYVKVLGGVQEALLAVKNLKPFIKVVQLKSKGKILLQEANLAARLGASIIMIDTGDMRDVGRVDLALRQRGLRKGVKLAFAGDISIGDVKIFKRMPVEIVDIGKAIVDAPLLDMRMDVEMRG